MNERGWIEPIVERVVGQVLDSHTAQLRTEIVRRVMEEIAAAPAPAEPTRSDAASAPADLARAVAEIQLGASQREILRALLDTSSRYAARVALFVVKGSHATGWQGRGFATNDAVKDFALDENAPAVVRVIDRAISRAVGDNVVAGVPVADLDPRFLQLVGAPASGEGRILPLILKDKVAALVYADSGTDAAGVLDAGALELLVLSTSAWLEVNSLRKQAQKEPSAAHADSHNVPMGEAPPSQTPMQQVPMQRCRLSTIPLPRIRLAMPWQPPRPRAKPRRPLRVPLERLHWLSRSRSVMRRLRPHPSRRLPPSRPRIRKSIARPSVLPACWSTKSNSTIRPRSPKAGRNKDLYDRLKEAIEKSRATYQKRYGNTVAASGNYFQHEIIRSLAEDDVSIMGANFRQ